MSSRVAAWVAITGILAFASATPAIAQDRPDFSGTWKAVEQSLGGQLQSFDDDWTLVIEQDASQIYLAQSMAVLEHELVYRLDGSESRNQTQSVSGEQWTHLSRADWMEGAIVIRSTTTRESGRSWESLVTYYLDVDGRLRSTSLLPDIRSHDIMGVETIIWVKQP